MVCTGELFVLLRPVKEELSDTAAEISCYISKYYDPERAQTAFGGCDASEEAFIKAECLLEALDKGVALVNRRSPISEIDVKIITETVLVTAYRDLSDIDNPNLEFFTEEEVVMAKQLLGPSFVGVATKFAEKIRSFSSMDRRRDAIDELTIAYANSVIEIYRGGVDK